MSKLPRPEPMGPVDYDSTTPPLPYHCGQCGVHSVKLWRDFNTFLVHQSLLCGSCACKEQGRGPVVERHGVMTVDGERGDQIGFRVPAVPTADGSTYWGYTSVPSDGVTWWKRLPLSKETEP